MPVCLYGRRSPTLLQLKELGIIPVVFRADPALGVDDLRADLVEELAVVAHDDHGYVLIAQECLEPLHALEIEVICRSSRMISSLGD